MIFNPSVAATLSGQELLSTEVGQYLLWVIHGQGEEIEHLYAEIRY